jgi:hypothetical protein
LIARRAGNPHTVAVVASGREVKAIVRRIGSNAGGRGSGSTGGSIGNIAAVFALLAFGLSGCADEYGPDEPSTTSPPPATTPGQSGPERSRPPEPPSSTNPKEGQVLVHGTVERGVEPNCLVLVTDEQEYLLVNAGPEIRPGARIVVRGTPEPDLVTTCMQGVPLVVDDVDLAEGGAT